MTEYEDILEMVLKKVTELISDVEDCNIKRVDIAEGLTQIKHEIESMGTRPMIILKKNMSQSEGNTE